jgi:hypothetical protein
MSYVAQYDRKKILRSLVPDAGVWAVGAYIMFLLARGDIQWSQEVALLLVMLAALLLLSAIYTAVRLQMVAARFCVCIGKDALEVCTTSRSIFLRRFQIRKVDTRDVAAQAMTGGVRFSRPIRMAVQSGSREISCEEVSLYVPWEHVRDPWKSREAVQRFFGPD